MKSANSIAKPLLGPQIPEWLSTIDTFLVDCDGVLWRGSEAIPGAREAIAYLRGLGKRVLFITNNSRLSRSSYWKKLLKLNILNAEDLPLTLQVVDRMDSVDNEKPGSLSVPEIDIVSSGFCAAYYLKKMIQSDLSQDFSSACLESGLEEELRAVGLPFSGGMADAVYGAVDVDNALQNLHLEPKIMAVLFGFDSQINYIKYAKAYSYLKRDSRCQFIATNDDRTLPMPGGIYPGTGSLLASLVESTQRKPLVLGKPHEVMWECIRNSYDLNPSRTCMIGDRLETDILFGHNCGLHTLLVLSGVTSFEGLRTEIQYTPDYYVDSMKNLVPG